MNKKNMILGILFILGGVVLGLNALELTSINLFFDGWWTLFIIIPALIDLGKNEDPTGNLIAILIGVVLLLCAQDIISFEFIWKLLFPIVLVIIGCSILFKDKVSNKIKNEIKKLDKENEGKKEYYATFSNQELNFEGENFEGCKLNAIFGGATCDLKNAKIKEDVVIKVSAIFGGIDIFVPDDINVKVLSTAIFGGIENKRKQQKENAKTIYIEATCLFGGVEIK